MRTTRAFIAGLGTTGSLVGAVACAFLVTSALVAFNGWPGGAMTGRIGSQLVGEEPVPVVSARPEGAAAGSTEAGEAVASTPSGPVPHPAADVPAAAAEHGGGPEIVQIAPGGRWTRLGGGGRSGDGSGGGHDNGPGDGSSDPGAGTPPAAPQPPSPVPATAGTPPVSETTAGGVGDTVSGTTGQVGDVVSGTTDQVGESIGGPVGEVVTGIGQAVDDAVTNIGQAVDDLVTGLVHPVGGALGPKDLLSLVGRR